MNDFNPRPSVLFKTVSSVLWILFLFTLSAIFLYYPTPPKWEWNGLLRINSLTLIILTAVTFFSAIVCTFASKYLVGFKYYNRFIYLCIGFTSSVSLLVLSEHVVLLLLSWLSMGYFMARLIGIDDRWGDAREARKYCQRQFFLGSVFLAVGLLSLSFYTQQFTLDAMILRMDGVPFYLLLFAALCIIVAAAIQSAMYPFHRWLLSAMTSPTPASALMHAGFVNAAGILLTLLAPLFFKTNTMTLLIIIGGVTAIVAQFTKLIQVNIKQKLGCSTSAQMAFMIMQCGLGYFNAAVVHLILHGCYKAYLFLSVGEEIQHVSQRRYQRKYSTYMETAISTLLGILGALVFALLTGKGMKADGGIFLTLIVAITVGQAMNNIIKRREVFGWMKYVVGPIVFFFSIALYALMYNGTTSFMRDLPMIDNPQPLSVLQIVFGVIFLLGFFIMKLGIYKNFPWLYVRLVNDSQPNKNTVLLYKKASK